MIKEDGDFQLNWLGIDFDDTIAHNTGYPEFAPTNPIIGTKEAIEKLRNDGWKIVIHTARAWSEYDRVKKYLKEHSIYFDKIICGKLLVQYYIDDRSIEFDGNWEKTLNKIRRK